MRINKYRVELDDDRLNTLVKESGTNYAAEKRLDNPGKIVRMLNTVYGLNRQAEENVYLIGFDAKMKPLGVFEVSHGAANLTVCNPREIYIRALLCGAANITLCHNHPSGDCSPSEEDISCFHRAKEAGKIIGVELVDFIIDGDDYYSFSENGLNK